MYTIRQLRDATGLSQEQFSRQMGIPKKTLQHWESTADTREAKDYILSLIERVIRAEHLDKAIPLTLLDQEKETAKEEKQTEQ